MNYADISLGTFSIDVFAFFVAFAFFVGVFHYYQSIKKSNLSSSFFVQNFWKWLLAGFVIGRTFAFLVSLINPPLGSDPTILTFWDDRINFFGFLLGFLTLLHHDLKKTGKKIAKWLDKAVIPFLLASVIIDIGIHVTGEIYGIPTTFPWGIEYQTNRIADPRPLHPVGLYLFIPHLFILIWQAQSKEFKEDGVSFFYAAILWLLVDFVVYFFRGDDQILKGVISIEQVFNLIAILSLLFVFKIHKQKTTK